MRFFEYANRDLLGHRNRLVRLGNFRLIFFAVPEPESKVAPRTLGVGAWIKGRNLTAEIRLASGDGCRTRELLLEETKVIDWDEFEAALRREPAKV